MGHYFSPDLDIVGHYFSPDLVTVASVCRDDATMRRGGGAPVDHLLLMQLMLKMQLMQLMLRAMFQPSPPNSLTSSVWHHQPSVSLGISASASTIETKSPTLAVLSFSANARRLMYCA